MSERERENDMNKKQRAAVNEWEKANEANKLNATTLTNRLLNGQTASWRGNTITMHNFLPIVHDMMKARDFAIIERKTNTNSDDKVDNGCMILNCRYSRRVIPAKRYRYESAWKRLYERSFGIHLVRPSTFGVHYGRQLNLAVVRLFRALTRNNRNVGHTWSSIII